MRAPEAGRELDALIAERVMGWQWVTTATAVGSFEAGRSYLRTPGEAPLLLAEHPDKFAAGKGENPIRGEQCPAYSTDIAAAWEVFERLPLAQIYHHAEGRYTVAWGPTRHSADGNRATADTAPLAICRAALHALASEVAP